MQVRLDKFLADAGCGTRSEVRDLIRKGRVTVDGGVERKPERKVDITSTGVQVDGTTMLCETCSYYILNKPHGVLSASRDGREKTVIDLIPEPKRRDLFPVGRLDKDTVGLLLITNDGKLSNRLMAPGKHVPKTYIATVSGKLPVDLEERFSAGVDIGDETPTAPAEVRILRPLMVEENEDSSGSMAEEAPGSTTLHEVELTITEGRYHQVKRMFEAVGCKVEHLERTAIANLTLPTDLPRGTAKKVTLEELVEQLGI